MINLFVWISRNESNSNFLFLITNISNVKVTSKLTNLSRHWSNADSRNGYKLFLRRRRTRRLSLCSFHCGKSFLFLKLVISFLLQVRWPSKLRCYCWPPSCSRCLQPRLHVGVQIPCALFREIFKKLFSVACCFDLKENLKVTGILHISRSNFH